MTRPDRRHLVESICDAALELPREAREAYLARACGDDAPLKAEVESLLAHASEAEHFLDVPVGAVAADVVNVADVRSIGAGTTLGHFEVLAPLGAGGQARVFRARDTELRRDVAVKVLTGDAHRDAAARAALLREARRAAGLSHPGIGQVFHVGDSPHGAFMVMELVDGETVRDALRAGPLPIEGVCRIGAEIARALDHAHAHGIVHRDLKSANVMLTRDGRVKVLDFGIAVMRPGADLEATLTTVTAADAGGIAGTVPYMAPEVLRGGAADVASDVWALGVVLYEMAAGRLPFDRETPSDVVASILRDPPAPLPAHVPAPLAQLIERCLAREPTQRPARAGEVALALEIASTAWVAAAGAVRAAPPGARRVPSSPWLRPRRLVPLAAAVVVAAAAAWLALGASRATLDEPRGAIRLQRPMQLTSATGVEEYPALSPDGRTIAYAATPGGSWGDDWDIWLTLPGGTPVNRTADYAGRDLFPSWSPDGALIAFWSDRDGGGCYVMPAVGGAARRVAPASFYDANPPVWSPDGRELSCVAGDPYEVELVTVDLATGQPRRRVALPARGRRMFVTPSPAGTRVAMVVSPGGLASDVTQLVVLDPAMGTAEPLTDGQTSVWSPVWSADGSSLFYVSNASGSADLWEQRLADDGTVDGAATAVSSGVGLRNVALSRDGHRLAYSQGRKVAHLWRVRILADRRATWADATQITFDQAFVDFADLSADGQRLAVSSDRAGSVDLWVLPAAGGEMRQVTSDPGAEWAPRWSPDGRTFAFYSMKSGNRDIYTMPVVGGEWRRLTTNPGPDLIPSWSPDGREVVHLAGFDAYATVSVTPVDGGAGREIARTVSSGVYSPDGQQIAFQMDGRLVRRSATGQGEVVELSRTPTTTAVWAPDGARLFFVGAGEAAGNLYAVGTDGRGEGAVTDLRNRRGTIVSNSLATDGTYLYFSWQEDLGDLWIADLAREAQDR